MLCNLCHWLYRCIFAKVILQICVGAANVLVFVLLVLFNGIAKIDDIKVVIVLSLKIFSTV